jgi:heme/copper-type cytochrome/quinol oxidase subunit 3
MLVDVGETVGKVVEYRSPRARQEFTAYVGMVIFLGSWAMLFCGMFMAYGFIRLRTPAWPPVGQPLLPLHAPILNTLMLMLSGVVLHLGYRRLQSGGQVAAFRAVAASTLLGAAFVAGQVAVWRTMIERGLTLSSSLYGSLFYTLTGIHLLHVLVGVVALCWLSFSLWRGTVNPARHLSLQLWGLYWHFVGAVWLLTFVSLYVI